MRAEDYVIRRREGKTIESDDIIRVLTIEFGNANSRRTLKFLFRGQMSPFLRMCV